MQIKTVRKKPEIASKKTLPDVHQKRLNGNPAIIFNLIESIVARVAVLDSKPCSESYLSDAKSAVWQGLGQAIARMMIERGSLSIDWVDNDGSIATTDLDFSSVGNESELISMLSAQEDLVIANIQESAAAQGRKKKGGSEPVQATQATQVTQAAQEQFSLSTLEDIDASDAGDAGDAGEPGEPGEAGDAGELASDDGDSKNQLPMPLEDPAEDHQAVSDEALEAALDADDESEKASVFESADPDDYEAILRHISEQSASN